MHTANMARNQIIYAEPCSLSVFTLQNVPILSDSNQELVDAHGGINSNFPAYKKQLEH